MQIAQRIAPCLWFDNQVEAAVEFYLSVSDDSIIVRVIRYSEAGYESHGRPAGTVMAQSFELGGSLSQL
jgi:predicted 3-demethylubiquinone-9 3-methyltransferase (glyoxalase superfamily)